MTLKSAKFSTKYLVLSTMLLSFVICHLSSPVIGADLGVGVAQYLPVSEKVETGDIISIDGGKYKKSVKENDTQMVGVVNLNPAVSIKYNDDSTSVPIIDSGETLIKVITKNGNIKKGDLITTSTKAGVGVKSIKAGFTIGLANSDYKNSNTEEVGTISVQVSPHFSYSGNNDDTSKVEKSITDIFSLSAVAAYESPTKAFKHVVAALILIAAIIFGFFTFGRIATYGIEAVGRNPLARKTIGLSMVINVGITVVIILSGLTLAYLIMVL